MGQCIIVGGGSFAPELFPSERDGCFIIAADSGYKYLRSIGVTPDLCVGDFDSLGGAPDDCPVVKLPVMKDDTDLISSAREGLRRGYTDFLLFGALGGKRFSHSLAAVQTLVWLTEQGARGEAVDSDCRVTVLKNGTLRIPAGTAGSVSILSYTSEATVTLSGFLYPLSRARLTNTFPLGVSNSLAGGGDGTVTVEDGSVIIITDA